MRDFDTHLVAEVAQIISKFAEENYGHQLATMTETIACSMVCRDSNEMAIKILMHLNELGYFNKYIE